MSAEERAGGGRRRIGAAELARGLGLPAPTPEQAAVIEAGPQARLVVAGAGSGKTETMAARVVWLVVNELVAPERVLGLTFTRKASIELADRVQRRLRAASRVGLWRPSGPDDEVGVPTVSTYHAYAGRLVSEHGLRVGVEPDARLLSEAAAWQVAHHVVERWPGPMSGYEGAVATMVAAVLELSGALAEHLLEPERGALLIDEVAGRLGDLPGRQGEGGASRAAVRDLVRRLRDQGRVYPLVQAYRDRKRELGALDFADQMAVAARLARDHPRVATLERERFGAVLLDEFQDTSEAQLVLLASLFGGARVSPQQPTTPVPGSRGVAVTAVGDPHQAIYGWRGASAGTLTRFAAAFTTGDAGAGEPLTLSTSWRNGEAVLAAANRTAAPLREGSAIPVPPLQARPDAPAGAVHAARLATHLDEARHVARFVAQRWRGPNGAPTGVSAAVLCRTRAQFDDVAEALRDEGLLVEVVGLGGLLDAPEVVDLVAALTVAQDPTRGDALARLLTGPVCRLGAADIDGLWAWAQTLARRAAGDDRPSEPPLLADAVADPPPVGWVGPAGEGLSAGGRRRVRRLGRVVDRLRRLASLPLPDLVMEAERALGLDIEVAADPLVLPAWGRAQLDALIGVAADFQSGADRPTLGGFIDWIDVARAQERGLEPAEVSVSHDAVQLLTVHAAKGLEWDIVAVPGLSETVFPSYRGQVSAGDAGWVPSDPTDRGWAGSLGALPYPLRGDRDWLPEWAWRASVDGVEAERDLEAFRRVCGAHQVAEERRLAYVALTRAREEALLTTAVWSTGVRPRVTSRFLQELVADGLVTVGPWEPMPDPADAQESTNPLLAQQASAIWPVAADARRRAAAELVQVVLEAPPAPARRPEAAQPSAGPVVTNGSDLDQLADDVERVLAERRAARLARSTPEVVTLPGHLAASTLSRLAGDRAAYLLDLRRPLPAPPSPQADLGTRFHDWVEQHYGAAGLIDLDDLWAEQQAGWGDDPGDRAGEEAGAAEAELARLQQHFLASPWAARMPLAVEVPVETVVAGIAVRGRIDAVFRAEAGGGVVIVDWKTGRRAVSGVESEQEAAQRALQLAAYRLAYARLAGLDLDQVEAVFFHAATGETERPALPGLAELEALLTQEPVQQQGPVAGR